MVGGASLVIIQNIMILGNHVKYITFLVTNSFILGTSLNDMPSTIT